MPKRKTTVDYLAQLEKDMVLVEKGSFMMGGNENVSDQPLHKVTIEQDFFICKYPVTQSLWKAVVMDEKNPSHFVGDNRPIENVSWDDVFQYFLPKLNSQTKKKYRLPSEAEWEYAARGGKYGNQNSRYSGSKFLKEVGWCSKNSGGETKPVGLKKANKLGLYDMCGNVWEWCQELDYNYQNTPKNDSAGNENKKQIGRGGSWDFKEFDCRISIRSSMSSSYRSSNGGFRLVRD